MSASKISDMLAKGSVKEVGGRLNWPTSEDWSTAGHAAMALSQRFAALVGDAELMYGEGAGLTHGNLTDPTALLFTDRFVLVHERDETKLIPWSRLTGVVVTAGDTDESAKWWSLAFRLEFGDRNFVLDSVGRAFVRDQQGELLAFAIDKLAASDVMTRA